MLPEPSPRKMARSPVAVVMLALPGRIRVVAWWVRVKMPSKTTVRSEPEARVMALTVVVPVRWTRLPVAESRLTVVAEAMSAPLLSFSGMFSRATRFLEIRTGMGIFYFERPPPRKSLPSFKR